LCTKKTNCGGGKKKKNNNNPRRGGKERKNDTSKGKRDFGKDKKAQGGPRRKKNRERKKSGGTRPTLPGNTPRRPTVAYHRDIHRKRTQKKNVKTLLPADTDCGERPSTAKRTAGIQRREQEKPPKKWGRARPLEWTISRIKKEQEKERTNPSGQGMDPPCERTTENEKPERARGSRTGLYISKPKNGKNGKKDFSVKIKNTDWEKETQDLRVEEEGEKLLLDQ